MVFVKAKFQNIFRYLFGQFYRSILRPIFFSFPPELIHDFFVFTGHLLGSAKIARSVLGFLFAYQNRKLEQDILGIHFANPIGLSEGFDKDAALLQTLSSVGFGFGQIGTITDKPYSGNPKPWLTRLIKSKAILVNYGLKNIGADKILTRITKYTHISTPFGISVGKTNCAETVETELGLLDYINCLRKVATSGLGDFITINISCPNTFGGEPFTTPDKLHLLLTAVDKIATAKPIFVKMPISISDEEFDKLLDVLSVHKVAGVIIGNLNKDHKDKNIFDKIPPGSKGGVSGIPTQELSNNFIKLTYSKYRDRFVIIGVGGVFTAQDAYKKIRLGASLVQIITGLVYGGPQTIGDINYKLVKYLDADGYENISEAVGVEHEKINNLQYDRTL
jgi:dihydroorotate dehydrogenase